MAGVFFEWGSSTKDPEGVHTFPQSISVKYSLADNMGQGKNPTVPSQSDPPEESDLWTAWQLFPLDDDQICHSKNGGSVYSDGQLWEEIAGAWRRGGVSLSSRGSLMVI